MGVEVKRAQKDKGRWTYAKELIEMEMWMIVYYFIIDKIMARRKWGAILAFVEYVDSIMQYPLVALSMKWKGSFVESYANQQSDRTQISTILKRRSIVDATQTQRMMKPKNVDLL